ADVWSLGVAWYEMVCLKVPFSASNLPAMALLICTSDPKPLPEEYSADLQTLIFSLLQKDPVKRPPMSAVVEEPAVKAAMPEPMESPRGWLRRLPEIDELPLAESWGGPEDDHGTDHRRMRGKRRCRTPWIDGQEALEGGYMRSPVVRHSNRRNPEAQASPDSHSSTPLPLTTPA
ncbi:nek3, partial [Symbiodinium pilosum]